MSNEIYQIKLHSGAMLYAKRISIEPNHFGGVNDLLLDLCETIWTGREHLPFHHGGSTSVQMSHITRISWRSNFNESSEPWQDIVVSKDIAGKDYSKWWNMVLALLTWRVDTTWSHYRRIFYEELNDVGRGS